MYINDDATGTKIAEITLVALKECAHSIGKIGPNFTEAELDAMAAAVKQLQTAIESKKKMTNAYRS